MKTAMKYLGLVIAVIALTFTSCTKDGEIGPMGPAGQDGQDGNANISVLTYDLSDINSSDYILEIPELTQSAMDNDLILGYITTHSAVYPIPQRMVYIEVTNSSNRVIQTLYIDIVVQMAPQMYKLYFYRPTTQILSGLQPNSIKSLKIIIAPSSNNTSGKSEGTNMRSQLKNAGVDINDYHAVMDYYGLEY